MPTVPQRHCPIKAGERLLIYRLHVLGKVPTCPPGLLLDDGCSRCVSPACSPTADPLPHNKCSAYFSSPHYLIHQPSFLLSSLSTFFFLFAFSPLSINHSSKSPNKSVLMKSNHSSFQISSLPTTYKSYPVFYRNKLLSCFLSSPLSPPPETGGSLHFQRIQKVSHRDDGWCRMSGLEISPFNVLP